MQPASQPAEMRKSNNWSIYYKEHKQDAIKGVWLSYIGAQEEPVGVLMQQVVHGTCCGWYSSLSLCAIHMLFDVR